jgi:hypothetical protein
MRRSVLAVALMSLSLAPLEAVGQPAPLVSEGNPVDWLFVYKNSIPRAFLNARGGP